jgi:hypothetical protein
VLRRDHDPVAEELVCLVGVLEARPRLHPRAADPPDAGAVGQVGLVRPGLVGGLGEGVERQGERAAGQEVGVEPPQRLGGGGRVDDELERG